MNQCSKATDEIDRIGFDRSLSENGRPLGHGSLRAPCAELYVSHVMHFTIRGAIAQGIEVFVASYLTNDRE